MQDTWYFTFSRQNLLAGSPIDAEELKAKLLNELEDPAADKQEVRSRLISIRIIVAVTTITAIPARSRCSE